MIFYFSGTGNSQLAAKQIAETVKDEVVSVNKFLKEGKTGTFHSEKPFVFVTPTYAWRIPKVVERWIQDSSFAGNLNVYFVLTCGESCGNAAAYAQKLCGEKGLQFCGLASVAMPENYIAMFPSPNETECRAIIERAKPTLAAIAAQIERGEPLPAPASSFRDKLLSGLINVLYYPLFVHDRGFAVSDACVSCGRCAQRCLLNNIDMINGRPVWKGNCTHCMACIAGCSVGAIEYKTASEGRHRHYIMED